MWWKIYWADKRCRACSISNQDPHRSPLWIPALWHIYGVLAWPVLTGHLLGQSRPQVLMKSYFLPWYYGSITRTNHNKIVHVASQRIASHRIVSCHVTSYRVMSCHVMSYHIIYIISYISYHIYHIISLSYDIISHHIIYHIISISFDIYVWSHRIKRLTSDNVNYDKRKIPRRSLMGTPWNQEGGGVADDEFTRVFSIL